MLDFSAHSGSSFIVPEKHFVQYYGHMSRSPLGLEMMRSRSDLAEPGRGVVDVGSRAGVATPGEWGVARYSWIAICSSHGHPVTGGT